MERYRRRSKELGRYAKADLCVEYRRLGGLGGLYPPEKWRKDEVISSICDMEWDRLPEDQRKPDPPMLTPPCDLCGMGESAKAHRFDGGHNYRYTHDPDVTWVPESEEEAERLKLLAEKGDA